MLGFLKKLANRGAGNPSKGTYPPKVTSEPQPTRNFLDLLRGRGGDFGTPQEGDTREFIDRQLSDEFLEGKAVIHVQSSWLGYIKYNPYIEAMEIYYPKGDHVAVYMPVPLDAAKSLLQAPSKGKWVWAHFHGGFQPDGRHWIHTVEYHPDKTIRDFSPPVMGRLA